jgi:hypothetical protein
MKNWQSLQENLDMVRKNLTIDWTLKECVGKAKNSTDTLRISKRKLQSYHVPNLRLIIIPPSQHL